MVRRPRACLIDVYETAIQIDQPRYRGLMAELAGVSTEAMDEAFDPMTDAVTLGRLTTRTATGAALNALGIAIDSAGLDAYLEATARSLRAAVTLPDDTMSFLTELRRRGVRTSLLSNCADDTRALLDDLGLLGLVDDAVLSCEVGLAKPDPEIFRTAMARLGVLPEEALFVDDQPRFCAAAEELGITAVLIDRAAGDTLAAVLDRF